MAKIKPEFDSRNVKVIGLSVDPVDQPRRVGQGHRGDAGHGAQLPASSPTPTSRSRSSTRCSRRDRGRPGSSAPRPTTRPCATWSSIGPDKKIKLILAYPMTTGRNFDEVLRVIDSLQLTAKHKVATPVNWKQGEDVIIAGSVSDDEAREIYPDGWESPKPYIRIVPQPR